MRECASINRQSIMCFFVTQQVMIDWRFIEDDPTGETAWHLAGMYGHTRMCRWLLDRGIVGLNRRKQFGYTPLSFALNAGNEETVSAALVCALPHATALNCWPNPFPEGEVDGGAWR